MATDSRCLWIEKHGQISYDYTCEQDMSNDAYTVLTNLPKEIFEVSHIPSWPLYIIRIPYPGYFLYIQYNPSTGGTRKIIQFKQSQAKYLPDMIQALSDYRADGVVKIAKDEGLGYIYWGNDYTTKIKDLYRGRY